MSLAEELIRTVPPGGRDKDKRAEEIVLGNVLADPRLLDEAGILALQPADFYFARHAELFRFLRSRGPEAPALALNEARSALEESMGQDFGLAWLMEVIDGNYRDWEHPAKQVHLFATARRTMEAAYRLFGMCSKVGHDDTVEGLAAAATSLLGHIGGTGDLEIARASSLAPEFLRVLNLAAEEGSPAIPTGIADLDGLMGGGFHAGDLNVIGARPSCGKTSLARQIAVSVARHGVPVLFVSLEVSRAQIFRDIVTGLERIPAQVLRAGQLTAGEWGRALDAADWAANSLDNLLVTDKHKTLSSIVAAGRSQARLHGVKLVIVDYLQRVQYDGPRQSSRREEIGKISSALKDLAQDHSCNVLALAQLNRAVDKQADRRPTMGDLKESGDIEQDADLIGLLYRPDKQRARAGKGGSGQSGETELIVDKNRQGPTGTVHLTFHGPSMRFETHEPGPGEPEPQSEQPAWLPKKAKS